MIKTHSNSFIYLNPDSPGNLAEFFANIFNQLWSFAGPLGRQKNMIGKANDSLHARDHQLAQLANQIFIEGRDHQLALSGQPDNYCWPKNASKGLKSIDIISWPNLASQIFIEERDHQLALSGHPDIYCWPKKASKRLKTIDIIILLIYMAYTKAQQMIPRTTRVQREIKKEDSCYSHFLAKESKI